MPAATKIVYVGGGGSRGPGTLDSFINHGPGGADFDGCHIVIFDINKPQLDLVVELGIKMAREAGRDIKIEGSTDLRCALEGCHFVLSSYRPGGFETRVMDERMPLSTGLIGNETEGAGGFMMALRAVHVARQLSDLMVEICPRAWLVNYTNPVSVVSQALTQYSAIRTVSLCEGSIASPPWYARMVHLDEKKLATTMVGINHGTWSCQATYDGEDFLPILEGAYRSFKQPLADPIADGLLRLAITMGSLPNYYWQWYYLERDWLKILKSKQTTRAEDILRELPSFWEHYRQQAQTPARSVLDPRRSRGGIHELELALDLIAAIVHDRPTQIPVNVPNRGAIADLDDDLVVEVPARVDGSGVTPLPLVEGARTARYQLPAAVLPLLLHRAGFQKLAARAAWSGTGRDAIAAMAAHPLVRDLPLAAALYRHMSSCQRQYLPERLWPA
jgi:6-phospho-beta-glucosidase